MRPLIVANVEQLESEMFLVAILYGADGLCADKIIVKFDGYGDAFERLKKLGGDDFELYTADKQLFKGALEVAGIAVSIKRPSDVDDTRREIELIADLLREVHEIEPVIKEERPKPSKLRGFLVKKLEKILMKLRGDYDYEI
ncbi:hypothetical protein BpOF4_04465 [Alkalihalophilus pseudofirmus OF4]|uniref:Uncharacterized protein n=1 Tax=Alkalihalophilus pseudofirmus (strain ATCC BAA-2126 / JCM 17055 / OF4) TaxID=398511 RepID=D3FYS4_ALKPO|nr:hypothetical protein [Alkalihalophilus pseudofirmus]ADC48957.1 hypothetical protein BpOF4_04465 [Alkalihalophilus pseudofirmus OF4]